MDQAAKSKSSRNEKYRKLQKKRRNFFYRRVAKQHRTSKQKSPIPPWPINIESIRLVKNQHESPDDTTDTHADRVLDTSLEKLRGSLNDKTPLQYKSTLNEAVENATDMICDIMEEIGKRESALSPEETSPLGFEDVLFSALGANVPPVVVQRALKRMASFLPMEVSEVTNQIIHNASHPPDILGEAGKSLISMESVYGFFSPAEGGMNAALLPVEAGFYKDEPTYMASLRPSISNSNVSASIVEHQFLNMTTD